MPTAQLLEEVYAPIREPIGRVEALLHEELSHDLPQVRELVEHSLQFGGKRIRPALVLISARLCGEVREPHVPLAAVVELLHHATLIHDDVLDEADTRRHVPTLNAQWGNAGPVLLGDFVFARAFHLCARLDIREANLLLARTAEEMCVGEMTQTLSRGALDIGEERYLDIIRRKTASLFGAACRLGAIGNPVDPRIADALEAFGTGFGMAFQITDDYLDVTGEEREVGKSLGTDVAKRKATLPVLVLRERLPAARREELGRMWAAPDGVAQARQSIARWTREYGVGEIVRARAQQHLDDARQALEQIPDRAPRAALLGLTEFVLDRRF